MSQGIELDQGAPERVGKHLLRSWIAVEIEPRRGSTATAVDAQERGPAPEAALGDEDGEMAANK